MSAPPAPAHLSPTNFSPSDEQDDQTHAHTRTWSYYTALILLVAPVWSITPLSWAFILIEFYRNGARLVPRHAYAGEKMLVIWALLEALFSLHHWHLVDKLSRRPAKIERAPLAQIFASFNRILHIGLHPATSASTPPASDDSKSTNTFLAAASALLTSSSSSSDSTPADTDSEQTPLLHRPELGGRKRKLSDHLAHASIPQLPPDDPRAVDFRTSLRTWFSPSTSPPTPTKGEWTWQTVSRAHMRSWLTWSLFDEASTDALSAEQREVVECALSMMERRAGMALGSDGDSSRDSSALSSSEAKEREREVKELHTIKPLRLTLDPMSVSSRPLIAYAVINFAGLLTRKWLGWAYEGVKWESVGGIDYLRRIPSRPSSEPPILFLHGLGIGFPQYYIFIRALLTSPALAGREIVVPVQPHVSQQIGRRAHLRVMKHRKVVKGLEGVVKRVGGKVVVVSHSNGTVLHAWLLKAHPELIHSSCFIDPVTFCLWEGDVCYNFVYKRPTNGLELLMRYYVGSELGIANYIQRNFDWSANTLFFEEIPNALDPQKTHFILSGGDSILSSDRVRRYLRLHGVTDANLTYIEGAPHGAALIGGGEEMKKVMHWIEASGRES